MEVENCRNQKDDLTRYNRSSQVANCPFHFFTMATDEIQLMLRIASELLQLATDKGLNLGTDMNV